MTGPGGNGSNAAGCGCLALIALVFVGVVGSCNAAQPAPTGRPAMTTTTATTTPDYYTPPTTTITYYRSPTSTSAAGQYDDDDDYDRPYVPVPRAPGRTHSGNTGHPCLAGERDGDDDGYCGEG